MTVIYLKEQMTAN